MRKRNTGEDVNLETAEGAQHIGGNASGGQRKRANIKPGGSSRNTERRGVVKHFPVGGYRSQGAEGAEVDDQAKIRIRGKISKRVWPQTPYRLENGEKETAPGASL